MPPCAVPSVCALPVFPPLQGPPDSPYAGGEFELVIAVPEQYPLVAPAGVRVLAAQGSGG